MGLETGTYISDLNALWPLGTDPKAQGANHLRLLKSTLLATLPNLTGAMTASHTELNYVVGVTSAIQTQLNAKSPTAGSTSLVTLGTVTTGTWNATAIASAYIASGLDVAKLTTGSTLPSNITASSLTSVGTLSVLNIGGTLGVSGTANMSNINGQHGDFTGHMNVGTTLGVTGNATVAGTLGVTGATTLAGLSATTGAFSGAISAVTSFTLARAGLPAQTLTITDGAATKTFSASAAIGGMSWSVDGGTTAHLDLSASTFAITPAVTMASTLGVDGTLTVGQGGFFGTGASDAGLVVNGRASGTNGGSSVLVQTDGTSRIAIGNKSNLVGGAFDATPMIYCGGSLLTHISGTGVVTTTSSTGLSITGALSATGTVTLSGYGSGGGVVSVGAADSGGTGYKLLRVPN